MTPSEREKIATAAGWKFTPHDDLIFTAQAPADNSPAIHAEIVTWIDNILAAKAEAVFEDIGTALWDELGQPSNFEDAIVKTCNAYRDTITPKHILRTGGLLGHTFTIDPNVGEMLVLTPSHVAYQKAPEYILYHHDAIHLELMRAYAAAYHQDWFKEAVATNLNQKAA